MGAPGAEDIAQKVLDNDRGRLSLIRRKNRIDSFIDCYRNDCSVNKIIDQFEIFWECAASGAVFELFVANSL